MDGGGYFMTVDTPTKRTFTTTWNASSGRLNVAGLGSGEAVMCDSFYSVLFTFDSNPGPSNLKGPEDHAALWLR